MKNIILVAVILLVASGAIWYIYNAKKRGEHCIGCPHAKKCGGSCTSQDKRTDL